MRTRIAPLIAGLVTSLALGGCGSSGSGGSGGTNASGGAGSGGTGATGGSSAGGSGGATGGSSGSSGAGGSGANGGTGGAGTSFACGALATCQPGQYCEKFMGGACGGDPPDDAGVCQPNCNKSTCGGSQEVCLCQSFTCKALPSGCNACACANAGCDCTEDGKGGVFVTCAAP